jgi:ribosomal protein L17
MRHSKHKYKLGVNPSHRKSLMRNLAIELLTMVKSKLLILKLKLSKLC